jgi:hypothetical protein
MSSACVRKQQCGSVDAICGQFLLLPRRQVRCPLHMLTGQAFLEYTYGWERKCNWFRSCVSSRKRLPLSGNPDYDQYDCIAVLWICSTIMEE